MSDFIKQLNPVYFWDVDFEKIDDKKSKRLIIERVITLGNLKELKALFDHYGKEEVLRTICNLNYLDPKTLNFFSLMYDIPLTEFKCYTKKQSNPQHWTS